jgi:hypothetical protein
MKPDETKRSSPKPTAAERKSDIEELKKSLPYLQLEQTEDEKGTKLEPKFVTIGKASKPLSLHPVKFEDAVSALLKTPPPPKPGK